MSVYQSGVKYIKLAKFDTGSVSNDLTTPLGEIKKIRVNYTDKGIVEYPVQTISEYPDYYLYRVATTNATSSVDNNQPEFHFDGSKVAGSISPLLDGTFTDGLTTNDISSDTLTYNSGNGTITSLTNSPIRLGITASIGGDNNPGNIISIISSLRGNLGSLQFTTNGNLKIDTTIFKDEVFSFLLTNAGGTFNSSELHFNTSSAYTTSTGNQIPVILEPFFETKFTNGDCDVLLGNATEPRLSTLYFDVDYSTSQIAPVNQQAILSGSAARAQVPDSNYTTKAIVNSRYIGKTLQASALNTWSDNDISFGKTITVGNPNIYFAYFNWVGGTSPEWGNHLTDRTAANIKYYVNENGDVIDPINDSEGINLGIARQNFEENKNAIIALDSDDEFGVNLGILNSEWPIFKSGYKIEPIIYTQTASYDNNGDVIDFGYTGSLAFFAGDQDPVNIPNYKLNVNATVQLYSSADINQTIEFGTPTLLGNSGSFSSDIYSPTGSNPNSEGVTLKVTANIELSIAFPGFITFQIQDSGSGTILASRTSDYSSYLTDTITFNDPNATTSSTYKLVLASAQITDPSAYYAIISIDPNTNLQVNQSPPPNDGNCTSFWVVDGSDRRIISASDAATGLNKFYNQTQKDISRSGFNPINYPFTVEIGDEIRFEGSEENSFRINHISASGQIILTLDREIPQNVTTDFFLVRRYVDDPSYIIMDADKPAGASSGGILKPQYLSSRVENNLDTILENLQDKNLI